MLPVVSRRSPVLLLTPCHLVAYAAVEPRRVASPWSLYPTLSEWALLERIRRENHFRPRIPHSLGERNRAANFRNQQGNADRAQGAVSVPCVPLPARLKSRRKCRPLFSICRFRYAVPDILAAVFFYIYVAYETKQKNIGICAPGILSIAWICVKLCETL